MRTEFADSDAGHADVFFAGLGVGDDVDASAVRVGQRVLDDADSGHGDSGTCCDRRGHAHCGVWFGATTAA